MCDRENVQTLQRGMNYRLNRGYSVILMCLRPNAPYKDRIEDEGRVLIYEGHDIPKTLGGTSPKAADQPEFNSSGTESQNGLFHQAAQRHKLGETPEIVRVYQKLWSGVWTDNGTYKLVDSWREKSGQRLVFKFKLLLEELDHSLTGFDRDLEHSRAIPAEIKVAVFKRDHGRCIICGRMDNLHFDHIIPFSKGGSSLVAANIQILCARHNLEKRDKIE
jgi:hypothetical protein